MIEINLSDFLYKSATIDGCHVGETIGATFTVAVTPESLEKIKEYCFFSDIMNDKSEK